MEAINKIQELIDEAKQKAWYPTGYQEVVTTGDSPNIKTNFIMAVEASVICEKIKKIVDEEIIKLEYQENTATLV